MSFHEMRKYKSLVMKKSGMDETEYKELLNHLLRFVVLVPDEIIFQNLEEARTVMEKIDPDDVVFVVAKQGIKDSELWSDDSDFDKQKRIRVLKSRDISRLFLS